MCDNGFTETNIDNRMTVRKDTASGKAGDDQNESQPSCMKTPVRHKRRTGRNK